MKIGQRIQTTVGTGKRERTRTGTIEKISESGWITFRAEQDNLSYCVNPNERTVERVVTPMVAVRVKYLNSDTEWVEEPCTHAYFQHVLVPALLKDPMVVRFEVVL